MLQELKNFINDLKSLKQIPTLMKNQTLYEWVINNTLEDNKNKTLAEKIYLLINPTTITTCCQNKSKRFISFKHGYAPFCGTASTCLNCKKHISEIIKNNPKSKEEKHLINEKRKETLFKNDGVYHNSQLAQRKEQIRSHYQNSDFVLKQVNNHRETMLQRYGLTHPLFVPGAKEKYKNTSLTNYGVCHPSQSLVIKKKILDTKKERYSKNHLAKLWGYDVVKENLLQSHNLLLLCDKEDYNGSYQNKENKFDFKCINCGHVFTGLLTYTKKTRCKLCFPTEHNFQSNEETELFNFITKDLNIKAEQGNKSIINPYQLDIVIPGHKIAIEYCGLYWHSQVSGNKDKFYHFKKQKLAFEKGFRLITIFSDEWLFNKHLVKDMLRAKLLNEKNNVIYARKTTVKKVDFKIIKDFLNKNHLQKAGYSTKINYALFHNNEIISVMSFSKSRKMLGSKNNSDYELVRYCSSRQIVGGAEKLFIHFINEFTPERIISYCDKRWFSGNVYTKLGFMLDKETDPGYFYTDKINRFSRTKFTKQKLVKNGFDKNLSEWAIMQTRNFDRIWDCGHYKFIWNKKEA